MKQGSGQGRQTLGQYGYDGTQQSWVKEMIDISAFKGFSQVRIRFGLLSDGSVQGDGFYYDDVKLDVLSTATSSTSLLSQKPLHYSLAQNYPNPFNPTTILTYQLPTASDVKLEVFDVLGKKVATLVNERQSAGTHNITFNASALSSGVYFYRLQAGTFSQTRKMLLVK